MVLTRCFDKVNMELKGMVEAIVNLPSDRRVSTTFQDALHYRVPDPILTT